MHELISVIIPVYNVERYLRPCLDSVIGQTYRELDIILVDDGSTDSSGEICREYARRDSRIRVIRQANAGQSAARNAGLDMASGKYVCFVDSDDVVAPNMLEVLCGLLDGNKIAMCDHLRFTDVPGVAGNNGETRWLDFQTVFEKMYSDNKYIVVWGKLYCRELFDDFRFREGIIYEDEDALPQLIYAAGGMIVTSRQLYFYRMRPGSTMSGTFSEKRLDIMQVCRRRIELFEQWGLKDLRKTAVKDYYLHLKRLERQTLEAGFADAHERVLAELKQWKTYGVRFSLPEKLRLFRAERSRKNGRSVGHGHNE